MRHRFHAICPYFAMFPEAFVHEQLAASEYSGVVFDPFCGRGTTMFEALLSGRDGAGCDRNPVAVCIAGAKCDPPTLAQVRERVGELRSECMEPQDRGWDGNLGEFFGMCYHEGTMVQVRYLRATLDWRQRKDDRFIAALCLGALHGESHRSRNYFSNRLPRTISTKPDYSVRWWRRRKSEPPRQDVFDILDRMAEYRFTTAPPAKAGEVVESDARRAADALPRLLGRVTDVVTSPPYLDTTNYREDQWLRAWFLGGDPEVRTAGGDDRHRDKGAYWKFIRESVRGFAPLLDEPARIVVRIGGRAFQKAELGAGLESALGKELNRRVCVIGEGVTSEVPRTQASAFRGKGTSRGVEHDFVFIV